MSAVVDRYGQRLHQLIRVRMGPALRARLESRDVLQATFLQAFAHLEQFEGSGSATLMGWLATIAQNEIRAKANFHHRQKRDAGRTVPLSGELEVVERQLRSEVSRLALVERVRCLETELEKLPADYREVIVLRKLEELSFPEVAAQMERSPEACRKLFGRAMAQLTIGMKS